MIWSSPCAPDINLPLLALGSFLCSRSARSFTSCGFSAVAAGQLAWGAALDPPPVPWAATLVCLVGLPALSPHGDLAALAFACSLVSREPHQQLDAGADAGADAERARIDWATQ